MPRGDDSSDAARVAGRTTPPGVAPDTYRALFEQSADAILIIDGDTFVDCNQATVELLRYASKEELLRTHPSELSPPTQPDGRDSFTKANEMIELAFQAGSHRFEWDHKRADGEVFPVEVLLTAVPHEGRTILHVVWRDITERKQLEAQLRQTQKLEAIGKLAGGIAHDFNNLLVAILGNAELLADQVRERPDLLELVDEVRAAADRAADLTRQLLTFSRGQVVRPRPIDLRATLQRLEKLLARLIGEDVELVTVHEQEGLVVRADPGQIEQVVVNLITNARDAMPEGGTVTLATREVEVDAGARGGPHALPPGRYAEMSVGDTGAGMSSDVAKKAFDPFFTTKPVGQGTGLGLSTVYGVLKQAGGEICIDSEPGHGTTVHVLLPLVDEPAEATEPTSDGHPRPAGRGETVLVVEDEPAVTAFVVRLLLQSGYRVLCAANGREALEQYARHRDQVDLVFTDTIMPEMGGAELVERLREEQRPPKVLMTSGYVDSARVRATRLVSRAELLDKPYTPDELLRRVRQVLDA
jgi:PAS domain S-box-containing protein